MKQHILPAIKLTAVMLLFFAVVYPFLIWGIAQFSTNNGKGEIIKYQGKMYYANVGQSFTKDYYFWSRPSSVDYNAAGSGGSNKSATNKDYLKQVEERIHHFLEHNPDIKKSEIPMDLITASGSGLDPDISVNAAKVQIKRISKIRKVSETSLQKLINEHTEKPLLGLFGPEKINVLKLNIALEQL